MDIIQEFLKIKNSQVLQLEILPHEFELFKSQFHPFTQLAQKIRSHIPGGDTWPTHQPNQHKLLEYFLTTKLLHFNPHDVYVDIASCLSVFPEYVKHLARCQIFRQDLFYSPGVNNEYVGSDACNLPFRNNSISKITLHCSFEHFQNNKDSLFIQEAERILSPNGQLIIIPFYFGDKYQEVLLQNFAPGCQFQRYYDPPNFITRVAHKIHKLQFKLVHFSNHQSIFDDNYCIFALLATKIGNLPNSSLLNSLKKKLKKKVDTYTSFFYKI